MTPMLLTRSRLLAVLSIVAAAAVAAGESPPDGYAFRQAAEVAAGDSGLVAENPAQGFRTRVSHEGVRVTPLEGDWEFGLSLARIGRGDDLGPVDPAGAEIDGHRTELRRGALVEWYINDERGLEQGFTLEERPAADQGGELVLALKLTGDLLPLVAGDGRRMNLVRAGDPLATLVYTGLVVVDAQGLELAARLELGAGSESEGRRLRIVVADATAVYPVTVDPVLSTSVWTSAENNDTFSVAWGDWDGDGDLDLAVGNAGQANRVYENDGLGQSASLTSVWTSADTDSTYSVAWGDWDGDGDLDLAAGNNGSANRVYSNDGLGNSNSLTPVWASADTDDTVNVAWGDWDGDGNLDLAAGNLDSANQIYENDGLGQSSSLTLAWTSADTNDTNSVAWGDWDGDGDLDLAAGNSSQANRVYDNDGLGQPNSLTSAWTSADTDSTGSVAWGDWDGDGVLDLAAGNLNQANRVYENDGLGLPTSLTSVWTSADTDATWSVAWGDWDGDGDLDLAAGNFDIILLNQVNRVYENDGLGLPSSLTSAWTSADTPSTVSVAWGDWDGDGDLDLAAGNLVHANHVYENTGGALTSAWTSADSDDTHSVAWGDWDGDGDLDLAAGNFGQANRVYENDGLGNSDSLTSAWTDVDFDSTESVAWGDWDGDGDLDLAAGNYGNNWVYENDGLGLPSSLTPVWSSADSDATWSVAWGDWDGDGDLDLADVATVWDHVYENDGLGRPYSLTSAWTAFDRPYTLSASWGDWDGDGDLDLAVGNPGVIRVYSNDGLGQEGSLVSAWTSSHETDWTTSVAWGDWDGDGDLDLAVGNAGQANLVFENDGLGHSGSLTLVWISSDSDSTNSVAWGDWDGDGDLDLGIGNNGANRVYENSSGALTSVWTSAETENTGSVAWGDWDGDGDLDLAAGNTGSQANRVYENGRVQRPGGLPETPVSPALPHRPGTTDSAFFFSSEECLTSPVTVEYTLTDEESDPALRIVPEYSIVGRAGWQPATEGPGGNGTTDLAADADGWDHVFVWDSYADSVSWDHDVVFRITVPHQASTHVGGPIQRGAMSAVSPPFRICDIPADISVTKDDGVTQVSPGQLLTYTIRVNHNSGLADAPGVRVVDVFPSALTGVLWTCFENGGGICSTTSGSGDIDAIVDLPIGTYVTFVAVATVTAAGGSGVANTVVVEASGGAPDPNLANNTATDTDVWLPADVAVTKDDGVSGVVLGQQLTYTITVSNAGPADAPGVRVTDDFPAALSGISWSCSESGGGTCGTAAGSGDIDETVGLPAGTHVTFTAIATVTQFGATGVTNTVLVETSPATPDPDLSDNSAADTNSGWLPAEIFDDGFEAGTTTAWSTTIP